MVIYLTTNLVNNKKYIGLDTHNNPRYLGSGKQLTQALKKYGRKNFTKEILEECTTLEDLRRQEIYWIKKLNAYSDPAFYNMTESITPIEHRKGKPLSEEHKEKISKANKGRKLPPRKKESIEKMLQSRKGYKPTEATKQKIRDAQKGTSKSQETRIRMSQAHTGKSKPHKRTPILQLDKTTNQPLREYSGFVEAQKNGFNRYAIQNACTANKNLDTPKYSSGGYKWIYKD